MSAAPVKLVITGGQIQLQPCSLYLTHTCAIVESHHVCPESWWRAAGKPVSSPLKVLCPDCHGDTHSAIDGIIRGLDISRIPPRCRALARAAFPIAEANGLTPALTL